MGFLDWGRRKFFGLRDGKIWSGYYGYDSSTGEPISVDAAFRNGAFFAAIRVVAQSIACLDSGIVPRDRKTGDPLESDHPFHDVISASPNEDQVPLEFFETMMIDLQTRGNFFAMKLMSAGDIVGLEALPEWPLTYNRRTRTGAREIVVTCGPWKGNYSEDEVVYIRDRKSVV